jgi:TPR repeat protein
MKTLLLLLALCGVAHADTFPASGPCEDALACEKACATNQKGTCYWGGVLVMQSALDEIGLERARKLFDRACTKGDVDACYQTARLVDRIESKATDNKGHTKALAAYARSCAKRHARGCFDYAFYLNDAGDAKSQKLAVAAKKKGVQVLEQRCTKDKLPRACSWVAWLYESGDGVAKDSKKAERLKDRACQLDPSSNPDDCAARAEKAAAK